MRKRTRIVTHYYDLVLMAEAAAERMGVPANPTGIEQLIAQGALIFRDPSDDGYLMVVQSVGVDILDNENGDIPTMLEKMLALPDTLLDVTPAPEEAVLADEEGWEIIFSRIQSGAQSETELAGLVAVAVDLSNLPADANPDVAGQILKLGGSIYISADDSDDYSDEQGDSANPLPAVWLSDGLNAALTDPQDAGEYPANVVRVVIPASAPRPTYGRLSRLADKLGKYGIGWNYEEFEDAQGNYHIGYAMEMEYSFPHGNAKKER